MSMSFLFFPSSQEHAKKNLPPACPTPWLRVVGWTMATRSCLSLSGTITWKKRLKRLSKENEVSSLSKNNFLIFSACGHSEVGATSSRITAALLQKNIFLSPPVWKTKIFSVLHPSLVHILHMLWKNSASLLLFHHWKMLSSSRISDSEPQVIYINENKYI